MIVSVLEQPESFFSAELCYTSEVIPRRSSTSVRFSLPAPKHNGHSIDSVGTGGRVVIVLADDIVLFPLFAIYEPDEKNVWFCMEIFGNRHSWANQRIELGGGDG